MLDEVRRIIGESEGMYPAVIVDAPLLFESGFDRECELVIAVTAPAEMRISRIIERDGITREAALGRISAQISDDTLISRAEFVIRNDSDLESLKSAVADIVKKIN